MGPSQNYCPISLYVPLRDSLKVFVGSKSSNPQMLSSSLILLTASVNTRDHWWKILPPTSFYTTHRPPVHCYPANCPRWQLIAVIHGLNTVLVEKMNLFRIKKKQKIDCRGRLFIRLKRVLHPSTDWVGGSDLCPAHICFLQHNLHLSLFVPAACFVWPCGTVPHPHQLYHTCVL